MMGSEIYEIYLDGRSNVGHLGGRRGKHSCPLSANTIFACLRLTTAHLNQALSLRSVWGSLVEGMRPMFITGASDLRKVKVRQVSSPEVIIRFKPEQQQNERLLHSKEGE